MSASVNNQTATVGIGALDLLGIAFIVLKLLGKISWSWWAVTAPLWAPAALIIAIVLVIVAVAGIAALVSR